MSDEFEKRKEERKKKTITIRNIDEDLYAKASAFARAIGESVGDIINEALRVFLSIAEGSFEVAHKLKEGVESTLKTITISDVEELLVTKEDLEGIEGKIKFRNIKKLIFEKNIDWNLFDRKVQLIVFADEVHLPENIPKLKALSKMKFVKRIIQEPTKE